ncbi:LysM peptidoglycan-binding domain-containing protein [Hymenobacter caeli]|uniref:Membrane-bound lytic murein transglycosylase D n=1 Tax=Hymenobacter caeli TaxID=2735894 RepID=A0ABX2FV45_9BACT|nr:LysM peptidoglycan-binding domain-containing protein [Hymenobacter caeli]NRT20361.1 membrane-bound lytic murein transglycosylase D [Hymenobacter caeli]
MLLALLALAGGPAAAQGPPRPRPAVPAEMDALGLHLVLTEEAQHLVQLRADALVRHQPSFQARVDLADAAFPLIDQTLQQAGVPRDFRYLALQESALQPDAQSPHGAVGYWQFKRETATALGLRVDAAVDERRHLAASTRGAARYLTQNNAALHNWLDALLSYYTGLGGVRPYTLPTDAGATEMAITADTSPYVLMFLAQKVAYEPACGLNPHPARLRELPAAPGQGLAQQAQALGVTVADLAAQNRWLLAATVPADGRAYTLVVPGATDARAAAVLARQSAGADPALPAPPAPDARHAGQVRLNGLRALIAQPGDTPGDLARRGGLRLPRFLRDNELSPLDGVVPGRPYYLEGKRDAADVEYYVVRPNETVADVAQRFGIRQHALLSKNRLAGREALRPGRVLWLRHTRPGDVAVEYRPPAETAPPARPVAGAPAYRPAAGPNPAPVRYDTADADDSADSLSGWPAPRPGRPRPLASGPAPIPAAATVVYRPAPPRPAPAPVPVIDEPADDEPVPAPVAAVPERRPALPPAPAPAGPVVRPVPIAVRPVVTPVTTPTRPVMAPVRPTPAAAPKALAQPAATAAAAGLAAPGRYQVQPHEGVYAIARRYNLRPADLLAWNQLPPNAGLAVGQVLRLSPPSAPGAPAAPTATPRPALPGPGPVAEAPASTRNITYQPRPAAPGAGGAPAPPAPGAAVWHAVLPGETLYALAKRYQVTVSDLQAWNKKPDASVRLGEVLRMNAPLAR